MGPLGIFCIHPWHRGSYHPRRLSVKLLDPPPLLWLSLPMVTNLDLFLLLLPIEAYLTLIGHTIRRRQVNKNKNKNKKISSILSQCNSVRRQKSQHHFRHHSDVVVQENPKFSSRSENPQPDDNDPAREESVNSSPTRERLLSSSQSRSSSSVQTQFRFQEPVVPEADTTSSQELSIVQVKWDSERKRRQGYFAQEEGSEKSPFRHYNKANCDFEG